MMSAHNTNDMNETKVANILQAQSDQVFHYVYTAGTGGAG